MSVRYVPDLDRLNQGPAGQSVSLPVHVEHQPGSTAAPVAAVTVKASFDDGAHWKPVTLDAADGQWTAHLRNPQTGYVSLQATAEDTDGNTVTQEILRAYAVG